MQETGKYIYCIIEEETSQNFASRNVGHDPAAVHSIHYKDIGAVISDSPIIKYPLLSANYLAHQRVIEESLFNNLNPLPVRFATIARDEPSILTILEKRHDEFKEHIEHIRGKKEMGLKVFWRGDIAYQEILAENRQIKELRDMLIALSADKTYFQRIEIGKLVEKAIIEKRDYEQEELMAAVRDLCTDFRLGNIIGDKMVLNASFLVDDVQEDLLDEEVNNLEEENTERLKFKYVGPVPPYNFVEITINISELGLN